MQDDAHDALCAMAAVLAQLAHDTVGSAHLAPPAGRALRTHSAVHNPITLYMASV
jgi:hypothetical protein